MPKTGRFSKYLHLGIDDDLDAKLRAEARRKGVSVAVLVRDLLRQGLAEEAAIEGRDVLDRAIRRVIKSEIEALRKLVAKAGHMAATAAYLNTQAIADMGKHDAVEMYHMARKKAATWLRVDDQDE